MVRAQSVVYSDSSPAIVTINCDGSVGIRIKASTSARARARASPMAGVGTRLVLILVYIEIEMHDFPGSVLGLSLCLHPTLHLAIT